jgi:hypothetical protein
MEEIWRDIPGYEGYYQISNLARIKSNFRLAKVRKGVFRPIVERIRKNMKTPDEYLTIGLSLNGKIITYYIHRILAEIFIPNPNKYPTINHINGIKHDCRLENLEWCTYSYNTRDELKRNNRNPIVNFGKPEKYGENSNNNRSVNQFDMSGKFIKCYNHISQVKMELGYNIAYIVQTCKHIHPHAYYFKWEFADSKNNE